MSSRIEFLYNAHYDGFLYIAPPAPAYFSSARVPLHRLLMHDSRRSLSIFSPSPRVLRKWITTYLVVWEDQCISNDYIFPPTSSEHYDFGDIVRCKRFTAPTKISWRPR